METQGNAKAQEDDANCQDIKQKTIATERTEEAGTNIDANGIDEEDKTKLLGKMKHVRVYLSPKVCQDDTSEQDTSNA